MTTTVSCWWTTVKFTRHPLQPSDFSISRRTLLCRIPNYHHSLGVSPISAYTMADSSYSAPALGQSKGDQNGRENDAVRESYAEIVVIRHGETEWNADRRLQGHLDVDLNDVGRQQAYQVADRLSKEPKISAVYASDLKRAYVTAEIIAEKCGVLEVIRDPDLRERNLGDLQGLVYKDLAELKPHAYEVFVSDRKDLEIPGGGESLDQLYERSTSAVERIAKKHIGERVVVVSHGGTIRALHSKASPHRRAKGKVLNTSVNILHLSGTGKWSIKSWGDVDHLDATGFLDSGFGGDKNSG